MASILYAVGVFVSDAPWYFMATVPFWGNERIKKGFVFAIMLVFSLLRAAAGYLFNTAAFGESSIGDYIYVAMPFLLVAVCSVCYKTHVTKLLYTSLLTTSISMPLSVLASLILYFLPFVDPFTGDMGASLDIEAESTFIIVVAVLTAIAIALIYRMFSGLLRRELSQFTAKNTLYLCATPALFFVFYLYGMTVPYVNLFYLIITPLSGLLCAYLNLRMIQNMQDMNQYQSDIQMQEMKSEFLLENYQQLETYFTQIAEIKHETRHHLLAVRTLFDNREYEKMDTYLSDIQDTFAEVQEPVSCGNRVIEAILGHSARRAREMGFEIEFELLPLLELTIPDADLVSLLMNLIENALESCAGIEDEKARWIQVKLKTRPPYLCLSIANARCGELIVNGDSYASTKDDPVLHGHGISVVKKIVEKHEGLISFEHTDDTFDVEVALPVMQDSLV